MGVLSVVVGGAYEALFQGIITFSSVYMVVSNIPIQGVDSLFLAMRTGLLVGIFSFSIYMLKNKEGILGKVG